MNHNLSKIIYLVILIMTFGSCKKINTSQVIEYNNQVMIKNLFYNMNLNSIMLFMIMQILIL